MNGRRLLACAAIGDGVVTMDALEIEGRLWLVPAWLESPHEGLRTPEIAIPLHPADVEWLPGQQWDFRVLAKLPEWIRRWPCEPPADSAIPWEAGHDGRFGGWPMERANH